MPSKDLTFILLGEDRTASSTMSQTAKNAEAATGRIGAGFAKLGSAVGGEFGDIISRTGDGLSRVGEKSGKLAAGLTVGGAAITGVGLAFSQMGSADKQASDQLAQAVKITGNSFTDYKDQFEKAIKTQENFGRKATDTQEALRKMTTASGSPKKALEELAVASNLAAAKHISLSEAADLVDRVVAGKGAKTLVQYGITMIAAGASATTMAAAQNGVQKSTATLEAAQLKLTQVEEAQHAKKVLTVADHIALENAQNRVTLASAGLVKAHEKVTAAQDSMKAGANRGQDALDQLAKKVDGQSSASVNNFAGQVNIARVKLEDWGAAMGQKVGPVLTTLGPILSVVGVGMELMRARQIAAAAATVVGTGATGAATVAQTGFNLSMMANPITLVIVAIVALVAGLIWFFTQTKLGKEIWANFTKFIGEAWQNIVKFITDSVSNVANAMNSIGGFIKSVFVGAANFIIDVFNNVNKAINVVIDGLNAALGLAKSLTGGAIDLKIGKLPMLPHLATGGTLTRGGLAMVGERGPEVVKLPAGATVYPTGGMPAGGGGGLTIGTFIAQTNQSPREIAQEMGWIARWAI